MSDEDGIRLTQRTLPDQLRYLSRKLQEPAVRQSELAMRCKIVSTALEVMAQAAEEGPQPPTGPASGSDAGPDDGGFFSGGEKITARFDHSDKLSKNIGRH